MLFQRRDIGYGITAEHHVFLADESDAHAAVHVERARDDARAVELLIDDARADREAVQADDKAEQRGAVAYLYGLRHIEHAQQLLGKIERVAFALLEHKVGVGAQLIERDAEVFEPLSKAYGMPRATEEEKAEKARVMEIVLKDACAVPMEIMEKCCEAIDVIKEFAAKGSALAISDAGVGAAFCKAALQGASLNVYINTKSMANKEYAAELNAKADAMLEKYVPMAEEIFQSVLGRLK